ncbi:MAG: cytochrome c biogenesis CcdA family protein [Streptosporangiaceae bacterium]
MSGVASLVSSGPLLLAIPVAAAAGAVSFLSPCVLPLVPGYLSYITGMSGVTATGQGTADQGTADQGTADQGTADQGTADQGTADQGTAGDDMAGAGAPGAAAASGREGGAAAGDIGAAGAGAAAVTVAGPAAAIALPSRPRPSRRRAVAGTALFVLGFSALFASYGLAFGSAGSVLRAHQQGLAQVLGVVLILLGLMFAGVFERFSFAGRIVKPQYRPRAGLASAPLLGVLFGVGWSPCIGPALGAVLTLGMTTGTAARGALLAFVYGLGIGIPFMIVAFAVERGVSLFGWARKNARLISRIGGLLLIVVGIAEVTGAWSGAMLWLQEHWISSYQPPI